LGADTGTSALAGFLLSVLRPIRLSSPGATGYQVIDGFYRAVARSRGPGPGLAGGRRVNWATRRPPVGARDGIWITVDRYLVVSEVAVHDRQSSRASRISSHHSLSR